MPPQCLAARAVSLALALPRPSPALADPAPPHNLPNQQLRIRLFIPRFDAIPERRRRELFLEYYNLLAEAGVLPAAAAGSAAAGPGGGSGGGVPTTTGDLAAAEEDAQLELLRQEQAKLKEEYDRWGGGLSAVYITRATTSVYANNWNQLTQEERFGRWPALTRPHANGQHHHRCLSL